MKEMIKLLEDEQQEAFDKKRDKILNDKTLTVRQKGILLHKLHKMYYSTRNIINNKADLELLKEYRHEV